MASSGAENDTGKNERMHTSKNTRRAKVAIPPTAKCIPMPGQKRDGRMTMMMEDVAAYSKRCQRHHGATPLMTTTNNALQMPQDHNSEYNNIISNINNSGRRMIGPRRTRDHNNNSRYCAGHIWFQEEP